MHDPSPSQSLPRLGCLLGTFSPSRRRDTLDPLVVDYPACLAQQPCDLAIAIAAVFPGKLDNIGRERCVERCCPSAAQARRSETYSCAPTCSMRGAAARGA